MKKWIGVALRVVLTIVILALAPMASALAQDEIVVAHYSVNQSLCQTEEDWNMEVWFSGFEPNSEVRIDWGDDTFTLVLTDESGSGSARHCYELGRWNITIDPLSWWVVVGGSYLPLVWGY